MQMTNPQALFADAIPADNFLVDTDSYKYAHPRQYPAGTEYCFSYIEPRKPNGEMDRVLFFGLQMELAKLAGSVVTQEALDLARPFIREHGLEIYAEMFQHIIDVHDGRLPIRIDALPEGTLAPVSVPQLRIVNTDPKCWALPGFLETRLLRAVWYPSTVATISNYVVGEIAKRRLITDGTTEGSEMQLHDFGARGATSLESARIGGVAHLVNSVGTDNVPALVAARNWYGAKMAANSIPASEHSTATSGGRDGELEFMRAYLAENPTGAISAVADSYDLWHFINVILGVELRDGILKRDGVLVVRPDSGDPVQIVPDVIEALMAKFGFEYTETGYKILNPKVRVIQGDGVDQVSILKIMDVMMERGLAIGNIVFGMGGGLLQKVNRDMFSYSMKLCGLCANGEWRDVYKDPVTAKGTMTSKKGRIGVFRNDSGAYCTRPMENIPAGYDALQTVFLDGDITKVWTFDEVRAAAAT